MGERLLCKQEVIGSNPFTSTIRRLEKTKRHRPGQPGRGCCLKGEERVCHVTEADAPGANALDVSEKVSSCEAAGRRGLAPVRGGFVRRNAIG